MSIQLWSYNTASRTWDHHGPDADYSRGWPAKRYCPAMTSWNGKLYLWGGRDTVDRSPEFHNDLWEYDTPTRTWTQLQDTAPGDTGRPLPRYGLGQARVGRYWYLFGGFGSQVGDGPQLNDLWRCDLETGEWACLAPHDAAKDYTATATRPGVRRVMGMAPALRLHIHLCGHGSRHRPQRRRPSAGLQRFLARRPLTSSTRGGRLRWGLSWTHTGTART